MPRRKKLSLNTFMEGLARRNPGETEFHQAVCEVARIIIPYVQDKPHYIDAQILERITEPDRTLSFRVAWQDDGGNIRVNRGFRIQFSNAIGPYKGGLRFHRDLNLSVLKFLGFEQIFKNSLTTLPLGAGKGGADFNPKGKSDGEVMRFCQAFMTELYHHLGPEMDIPAGDIGVGAREISYLFGQYKRLTRQFNGVLTGKSLEFGGSHIRKEATGYGCAYLLKQALNHRHDSLDGKTCLVSGSGNVALYCAQKLTTLGARVVTLSDSSGFIHDPEGLNAEKLAFVMDLKFHRRGKLGEYVKKFGGTFHPDQKPWRVPCQLALRCATQNEIDGDDARTLIKNGCIAIAEGANMPVTSKGYDVIKRAKILYLPGKAANAGGVAVSGLEMSQNSTRLYWSAEEMDHRLENIMEKIHLQCLNHGSENGYVDYVRGANIAGFIKVADAMLAYGVL